MAGCCGGVGKPNSTIVYHDGKSAYEVWLEAGHTGTVDDFFEYLRGPAGESVKGDKGDDGRSAYQVWLDAGHTGTESDFLAWLRGRKGDPGVSIKTITATQEDV